MTLSVQKPADHPVGRGEVALPVGVVEMDFTETPPDLQGITRRFKRADQIALALLDLAYIEFADRQIVPP